jgi:hypothetical protein
MSVCYILLLRRRPSTRWCSWSWMHFEGEQPQVRLGVILTIAAILSIQNNPALPSLKGNLTPFIYVIQTANTSQPHFWWSSNSLHSSCHISNNHHAKNQGYNHRVYSLIPWCDPQLCWVRYDLFVGITRYVACTNEGEVEEQMVSQTGHVRRWYLA